VAVPSPQLQALMHALRMMHRQDYKLQMLTTEWIAFVSCTNANDKVNIRMQALTSNTAPIRCHSLQNANTHQENASKITKKHNLTAKSTA